MLIGIIESLAVDCMDAGGRAKQDARAECYSHMGVKLDFLATQLRPVERHHMAVVTGAQHQGRVVTLGLMQNITV